MIYLLLRSFTGQLRVLLLQPKTISYILDKLGYEYKIVPEQGYDLSNHIHWDDCR